MPRRLKQALSTLLVIAAAMMALTGLWWHSLAYRAPAPRPVKARKVAVAALWYSPNADEKQYGISSVTVAIEPKHDIGVWVGFSANEAQGTEEAWRAAAWEATLVASLTYGIDLQQYAPTYTVKGPIDGPSASALLAVAVLAGLKGDKIRPNTTLTGTIVPNGTIAPVNGVAAKVRAAAKNGIKLVLIPEGQGQSLDPVTQGATDLKKLGARLGVKVHEVADLAEAYNILTGGSLAVRTRSERDPTLPSKIHEYLESRTKEWLEQYQKEFDQCHALVEAEGSAIGAEEQLEAARRYAERAQVLLEEGKAAAGYDHAVAAAFQASATVDVLRTYAHLKSKGLAATAKELAPRDDRDEELAIAAAKIADQMPATVDGLMASADAFGLVAQAGGMLAARKTLQETLKSSPSGIEPIQTLFRAAILKGLDRHWLEAAYDRVMLRGSAKGRPLGRDDPLNAWAVTIHRTASANLVYLKAGLIEETARRLGLHPNRLRKAMEYGDPTYLCAQTGMEALPTLQGCITGKEETDAAMLGTAVMAYAASAMLATKLYSLQAQVDEEAQTIGLSDVKALDRLLTSAATQARTDITVAQRMDLEATIPTFYYLVAQEYAKGNVEERLEALQYYWQASLYAKIATLLATP
ncbi:MAG: S16 family serine protease [Candidatus Zipacnadales bacterium]